MNNQTENNKNIVLFWSVFAGNQRKPEEAVAKYLGAHYRQHNPGVADGPEPFMGMCNDSSKPIQIFAWNLKRSLRQAISWCCTFT